MLSPCKSPSLTLLTALMSITSIFGTPTDPNHASHGDSTVGELEQLHKTTNLEYSHQNVKLRESPHSTEFSDFHDIDNTAWPRIGKGLSRKLIHNKHPHLSNRWRSNDESVSLSSHKGSQNHISQPSDLNKERLSHDNDEPFAKVDPSSKTPSQTSSDDKITLKTLPPLQNSDNSGHPSPFQPSESNNINTNIPKHSVDASSDKTIHRFARSTQSDGHEMRNRADSHNFSSDRTRLLTPGQPSGYSLDMDNFLDHLRGQHHISDKDMAQLLHSLPRDIILMAPLEIQYDSNNFEKYDKVEDVAEHQISEKTIDENFLRRLEQLVAAKNYPQVRENTDSDFTDAHDVGKRNRDRIMAILRQRGNREPLRVVPSLARDRIMAILRQRAKNTHRHREPLGPIPRRNRLHQIEIAIVQGRHNRRPLERIPSDQASACRQERDGTSPMTCPSADNVCLYDDMICDGTSDCPGGEDETFALCVLRHWTFRWLRQFRSMLLPLSKSAKKSS